MDYRQAAQKVETAYAPNQTIESFFHGLQPHFALRDGEESEMEYLRQLSDEILRVLLPEGEYQSDCVRWLVREILCCVILRSVVEILTEPDMLNYIVNVLLVDFEPTDEKYEEFLKKAADRIETSDDNFAAFLASLETYKGGGRAHIHRSSTPNIQSTDEMVTMLQDAQSSILERQRHTQSPLSRVERNDGLFAQRNSGTAAGRHGRTPPPHANRSPEMRRHTSPPPPEPPQPHYVPSLEPPLQIPVETKPERSRTPALRASSSSTPSNMANMSPAQPSRLGRMHSHQTTTASRIRSSAVWAVTEAPMKYTSYMINNFLIPFGAMVVVLLNFMIALPNRVSQVSQSMAWIYAELEPPEHTELETGTLKLLKEVFYLEERNPVVWRQWEIMGWPLIRTLGGGAIDRLLAHGVHWIFAEPQLVMYIQAGRRALWPDASASLPRPRGVDEMQKARKEAERRILRSIPAPLRDMFFGEDGVHHLMAAQETLEPFQNKVCNKHLMYIALDLLLSKVIPEIYPEQR
ncbi:sorting nexin 25 [Mortierella sp. GBA43]|nr:sorting nexin 25 [Mortierella sp. GBA43]